MREARNYTIEVDVDGAIGEFSTTIKAGPEDDQDTEAKTEANRLAREYVRDGDWGPEGASVDCWVSMTDGEYEWAPWRLTVEVEPDHDALMREAGADPDCDHEWTSKGEGGCDENPGVWSTGGTSLRIASHCVHCGLRRVECVTGSQRNPGEHDTVTYSMTDADGGTDT